jgi:hypothetical protein
MHASLKLLRKSIQKSANSDEHSCHGISGKKKEGDKDESYQRFKRNGGIKREKLSKVSKGLSERGNENNEHVLLESPKNNRKDSTDISKLRRVFGSEKTIKEHSRRINNEILTESIITETFEKSKYDPMPSIVEHEKSVFDRSAFEEFSYKKFQEVCHNQINECKLIGQEVEKEAKRK